MFLTKDKTFTRKALEALITLRIERALSKKEILERYLNVVQFGKDLYGVQAAAQYYFQKTPATLSLVESAFLTALLPSPERYAKSFHKKQLSPFIQKRLNQIIQLMLTTGKISLTDAERARAEMKFLVSGGLEQPQESPDEIEPPYEELQGEDPEL